mmetsp:Transcript_22756/g.40266  ORF Transcript_22756/g.40266 Transcript_22756/m.40266 type:complete len:266 (-) Transcript_22756:972-1769(-)
MSTSVLTCECGSHSGAPNMSSGASVVSAGISSSSDLSFPASPTKRTTKRKNGGPTSWLSTTTATIVVAKSPPHVSYSTWIFLARPSATPACVMYAIQETEFVCGESPQAQPAMYAPRPMAKMRTRNRTTTRTEAEPNSEGRDSAAPVSVKNAALTSGAHVSSKCTKALCLFVRLEIVQPAIITTKSGSMKGCRMCDAKNTPKPRARMLMYEVTWRAYSSHPFLLNLLSEMRWPAVGEVTALGTGTTMFGITTSPRKQPASHEMAI